MSNIARVLATLTGSALLLAPVTACGSSAPVYPASQRICVGPETPDDLEDLFDRDVVRVPDSSCYANPSLYGWVVTDAYTPGIGQDVDVVYASAYRRDHRPYLQSRSVNRVPGIATRSRLAPARPAPAPKPPVSAPRATAGNTAPKPPVSAPKPAAPAPKASVPSRSSSISRGGLGVNPAPKPAPKPPAVSKPKSK